MDDDSALFTLIAGLSSSGKSTWLRHVDSGRVIFPYKFGNDLSKLPSGAVVHYNTLRFAENSVHNLSRPFESDPFLREVLGYSRQFDVIYIACRPSELADRISRRSAVEYRSGDYPRALIGAAVSALDHSSFHAAWLNLLEAHARHLRLILSEATGFRAVSRTELIGSMTHGPRKKFFVFRRRGRAFFG